MRVLILADTHGFVDPRIAALAADCALVVHAGDIGNASVLTALQRPGEQLLAVRGNNDRPDCWPAADLEVLAGIPGRGAVELPGGLLAVEHGHHAVPAANRHRILRRRYPLARALIYGHSHQLCLDRAALPWILNPGAAGRTRTFGGPSCLLLDAEEQAWTLEIRRFPIRTEYRPNPAFTDAPDAR
jgi:putative phosphoesterase